MQFISSFKEFLTESYKDEKLNEIGDALVQPYSYSRVDKNTEPGAADEPPKYAAYRFNTDSGYIYDLNIFYSNNQLEIDFTANGSSKTVTNAGELFGVMSTITKIVKDYLLNYNRSRQIKKLRIEPSINYAGDHRRSKLYIQYVKKQLNPKNITVNAYRNTDIIIVEL